RKPESVCSERVRRKPERRRRKFRPETLRHRNGRRRQAQPPRGFWRAVDPHCFHPPKGSGARGRLISQVAGQKGGRRLSRRRGARVGALLQRLLANDVAKLKTPGKALYSCMLNERGGVIDDTIVYYLSDSWFRAVVNAGTRDKDLAWIRRHAPASGVEATERT